MRIYERDYRYLLQNVIPQHRLPPDVRRGVTSALSSGGSGVMRRESLRALEALCRDAYFVRTDVEREGGDVVVGYRRRGGRYRVSLAVPENEWNEQAGAADGDAAPAVASASPEDHMAAAPVAGPGQEDEPGVTAGGSTRDAVEFLPDIVRTFAASEGADPLLSRLDTLLETLTRWMGFATAEVAVVDDALYRAPGTLERVRVVTEDELRESERFRRSIETGSRRIIPKARLDGQESDDAAWGYLGIAPIFSMGKVRGILQIYFAGQDDEDAMNAQLEVTATVVRQIVEFHGRIENLTQVDALTGVYNRQFYETQLPVEVERAMRTGGVLAMLVLDIDKFKRINDELGHRKGDEALTIIADLIRSNLRKVDLPFRYGGEEFVMLLPGTSETESIHTAERLRRVVEEYDGFRDLHGHPRRLTVSVGVSVFPVTSANPEDLFVNADAAMYRAKQMGRNAVVLYSDDIDR